MIKTVAVEVVEDGHTSLVAFPGVRLCSPAPDIGSWIVIFIIVIIVLNHHHHYCCMLNRHDHDDPPSSGRPVVELVPAVCWSHFRLRHHLQLLFYLYLRHQSQLLF